MTDRPPEGFDVPVARIGSGRRSVRGRLAVVAVVVIAAGWLVVTRSRTEPEAAATLPGPSASLPAVLGPSSSPAPTRSPRPNLPDIPNAALTDTPVPVFVVRDGNDADLLMWHSGTASLARIGLKFPGAFAGPFGDDSGGHFTWLQPGPRVARCRAGRLHASGGPGFGAASHLARESVGARPGSPGSAGSSGRRTAAGWRSPANTIAGCSLAGGPAGRPWPTLTSRPAGRRARRRGRPTRTARPSTRSPRRRSPSITSGHRRALRPADGGARARRPRPVHRPDRRTHLDVPDRRRQRARRGRDAVRRRGDGADGRLRGERGDPWRAAAARDPRARWLVRVRRPLGRRDGLALGRRRPAARARAPTGRRSPARWTLQIVDRDGKSQTLVDAPRASVGALLGAKDGYAGLLLTATDPIRSQVVLVRLADGAASAVTLDSIGAGGPIGFSWAP